MRVLVAMSGGVDSSVAAARLVAEGHEVVGATLKLWGGESDTGCCSVSDVSDARRVADRLGIDHHTFGYSDEFDATVVGPYVEAHAHGRTPNPCMDCNRHVKFGMLLERTARLGFDALATGHHARIAVDDRGRRRIARGHDAAKDQSYVLAGLTSEQLEHIVFPVGTSTKDIVRAEAEAGGLLTASKPDSQDVCFITRTDGRVRFLGRRTALTPGAVVDPDGTVVGSVEAVEAVTVGQRRGLGLPGGSDPRYVLASDPATATVVAGTLDQLHVAHQPVGAVGWAEGPVSEPIDWQVSAHGRPQRGRWLTAGDASTEGLIEWAEPQRRVAPGQAMVGYLDDTVVAWATAEATPLPGPDLDGPDLASSDLDR